MPMNGLPTSYECLLGSWVRIQNGWIIGPIIQASIADGVYVEFGGGRWQLMTIDMLDVQINNQRLVMNVAPDFEKLIIQIANSPICPNLDCMYRREGLGG